MLFNFHFANKCNFAELSHAENLSVNETKKLCENRIINKPSWIEWLLWIWVFSFLCEEISQVKYQYTQILKLERNLFSQ